MTLLLLWRFVGPAAYALLFIAVVGLALHVAARIAMWSVYRRLRKWR